MFPELPGKKFNFLCFAEILFSCHQVNLSGNYEGDPPLSPKGGGNPGGAPPLTPTFEVFSSTFRGAVTFWGMPWRRGRKHDVPEPPGAIFEENVFYLFIKSVAGMCLYPKIISRDSSPLHHHNRQKGTAYHSVLFSPSSYNQSSSLRSRMVASILSTPAFSGILISAIIRSGPRNVSGVT